MRSKKALINIISSILLQIITIICGFIIPKLIIKTYGSNVNGMIASIVQFLAFVTLLESGFGPVIKSTLYKPIASKDKPTIEKILKTSEKIFRSISYIFIIYIIILIIILPIALNNEFDKLFTISLIIILSISTFAEYYFGMTYRLYLQAEQKTYVISIIQICTLILNTIAVILLIHFGASIQIVKLATASIFVFRPILQNIYVKKKYNINLKNVKDDYKLKQKWDGLAQHIAFVIHNNTDIVILTLCGNLAEVSVYSIYATILNAIKNIVQSINGGIDASFGDMIAKDEQETLNKTFKIYEFIYFTIATILFSSTLFLIIPFVKIYTKGITDVNYVRPTFAIIMLLAKFMLIIRQPYNDLVKTAGHFKETRVGAWCEAISNIIISFVLVWKFGIIGVAIGTLFAMVIRTIEFMYHSSKYILKRSVLYSFKRLFVIALEMGIITFIIYKIPKIDIIGYKDWIIQALIVTSISSLAVLLMNCIIYKENVRNAFAIFKNILKRNK